MGGKSTDNTAFGNTGERSATDKRFHAAVAGNADRDFAGRSATVIPTRTRPGGSSGEQIKYVRTRCWL